MYPGLHNNFSQVGFFFYSVSGADIGILLGLVKYQLLTLSIHQHIVLHPLKLDSKDAYE